MSIDLACPNCMHCLMTDELDAFVPKMGNIETCDNCEEKFEVKKNCLQKHLEPERRKKAMVLKAKAKAMAEEEKKKLSLVNKSQDSVRKEQLKTNSEQEAVEPRIEKKVLEQVHGNGSRFGKWWTYALASVICLAVGYFAGREHVKMEFRDKLAEAFAPLTDMSSERTDQPSSEASTEEEREAQSVLALAEVINSKGSACKWDVKVNKKTACIAEYAKYFELSSEYRVGLDNLAELDSKNKLPLNDADGRKFLRLAEENTQYLRFFIQWKKNN